MFANPIFAGDYRLLAGHAIKGNVLSHVCLLTFRSAIHCVPQRIQIALEMFCYSA